MLHRKPYDIKKVAGHDGKVAGHDGNVVAYNNDKKTVINQDTKKVAGHDGYKNSKSRGTIIDNLIDYSKKDNTYISHIYGGNMDKWQQIRNEMIRVPKTFLDKFPNLKTELAEKYYNKYLEKLREILLPSCPFMTGNYTHVALANLYDRYMTFQHQNTEYYIWNEFKELRPFFVEVDGEKGNGRKKSTNNFNKNSKVYIMNQKLIDFLIDTANAEELVQMYYGDLNDDVSIEGVPIDIKNLENFILSTTREIEQSISGSKHELSLIRNLRQAKYIKIISNYFYPIYNNYVLPQIPSPSLYGRMYYKGINIQNISKEVRNACLGEHYVYDLNAAVYAIKLMIAKNILSENNISDFGYWTYTKEYLEWKSPLRYRLSEHIKSYPDPEKLVKEAITAIGFGARISGGSWQDNDGNWQTPAIDDIIMNQIDRKNFLEDPWVREFVKEQHELTKFISKYYIEIDGFVESVKYIPKMFANNGKIRNAQVMSYLFQNTEKNIMDIVTDDLPVIARIHDSFITKKKLTTEQLLQIKGTLSRFDQLMTINTEHINAWTNPIVHDEISLHEERIEREEQLANSLGYDTTRVPKKQITYISTHNDSQCYDGSGYDGSGYENYNPDNDEYLDGMIMEERKEHWRIIGYNPNKLPSYIEKLL